MQGGVGAYTQILAQTLGNLGHTIHVLSTNTTHEPDSRIQLTSVGCGWRLSSLFRARQWARQCGLDVVSLQFETAAYSMSPWIHFLPNVLRHLPVITTFHDLLYPYLFPKAGPLRDWIVMHLARGSSGTITTNHEDYERLKHLTNARLFPIGSNISDIHADDSIMDALRHKIGVASDDFVIVHFGFLNHSKGIETLLEAMAQLQPNVKLIMVGGRTGTSDQSNVTYAETVDATICRLNVSDSIYWTGFVEEAEVSAYLQLSDGIVLPFRDGASFRRGSLMAAIQHGCAIVTTAPTVPIPEFRHEQNMLLVPSADVAALIAQIKRIMSDNTLRQKLKSGAKALSDHFRWEQIAADYITLFEAVRGS